MSFIISIIGIAIIFSEIQTWSKQVRLSSSLMTQIQLIILICFILIHFFCHNSLVRSCIVVGFVAALLCGKKFFSSYLETLISRRFHMVLDDLILGVQSGKSLSVALAETLHFRASWEQFFWNDLIEILNKKMGIDQITSDRKREVFRQILSISASQTKLIDQLQSLRNYEKKKNEFRRRSGAATQQIRAQAAILTLIFVVSCTFLLSRNGVLNSWKLIFVCSCLFIVGTFVQWWLVKSQKWDV
jgi:hypothetical protein